MFFKFKSCLSWKTIDSQVTGKMTLIRIFVVPVMLRFPDSENK